MGTFTDELTPERANKALEDGRFVVVKGDYRWGKLVFRQNDNGSIVEYHLEQTDDRSEEDYELQTLTMTQGEWDSYITGCIEDEEDITVNIRSLSSIQGAISEEIETRLNNY